MQNKMKKIWSMILVAAIMLSFFPGGVFSLNAEAATETDYETGYTWAFDQTVTLGATKGLVSGDAAGSIKVMNHEGNGNALTPERAIADGVLTTEVVKNWGNTVGHGVFYQLPAALETGRIYQLTLNLYGGNDAAAMNGISVSFGDYDSTINGDGGSIQQWTSSGIEGLHNADTKITHSISGNLPTAASNRVTIEFIATEAMTAAGWMLVSFPLALNGSYKLGDATMEAANYDGGYTWEFDQTVDAFTAGNAFKVLYYGNEAKTVGIVSSENYANYGSRSLKNGVLTTVITKDEDWARGANGVYYKLPAGLVVGQEYVVRMNLYASAEGTSLINNKSSEIKLSFTNEPTSSNIWTVPQIEGIHNSDTLRTYSAPNSLSTDTANEMEISFVATQTIAENDGWMLISFPLEAGKTVNLGSATIKPVKYDYEDGYTWKFDKTVEAFTAATEFKQMYYGNEAELIGILNHEVNADYGSRSLKNGVLSTTITATWNKAAHGVYYRLPSDLVVGQEYMVSMNLYASEEGTLITDEETTDIKLSFTNAPTTTQVWVAADMEKYHNDATLATCPAPDSLSTDAANKVTLSFVATQAMAENDGWMLITFRLEAGKTVNLGDVTIKAVNYEDGYTWRFDKTVEAFTKDNEFKTLYYGNAANTVGIVSHEGYGSNWGDNSSRSLKNGLLSSVLTTGWDEEGHGVYYKLPKELVVGKTYMVSMNLHAAAENTPMANDNSSSITVSFNHEVNTTQAWQISNMEAYHNAAAKLTFYAPTNLSTQSDNVVSFAFVATQQIVDAGRWMLITFPMEDGKTYILGDTTIQTVNYNYKDGYTWEFDKTVDAFTTGNDFKTLYYGNAANTVCIISSENYANYGSRSLKNGVLTTVVTKDADWARGANGVYYKLPLGLEVGQAYVVRMNLYASAEGTGLGNNKSSHIKLSFTNEPTGANLWTADQIKGIHNPDTLRKYSVPYYLSTDTSNELAVTFVATQAMADNDGWMLISMPLAVNGEVNLGSVTIVEKTDASNHFINGDLSDGLTGWMVNHDSSYISVQDSVLNASDKVPTGDVKLYQTMYLERGIYRLSFDVLGAPTSWRPVYFMGTALDNSSVTGSLQLSQEAGKTEGDWWTVTRDVTIQTAGTYYFQMNLNQVSGSASVAPAMQYDNFALRELETVTITWKDEDGTVLEEDLILAGAIPEYNGSWPTKEADGHNSYAFIGWDKEVTGADADMTYTAQYKVTTSEHSWGEAEQTKTPTCTEEGEMTYTCSVCGQTKTETILPNGEHNFDNGVVTKDPTCGEDGVMTYTCSDCGKSYTEAIDATGEHTVDSWTVVTHPTTTTPGSKTGVCTVCGTTLTVEIPVIVQSWNIILSDNIGLNFILALTQDDEVQVTVDGEEVPVELTKNADGTYKVFIEVAAAQMTSEIQIIVNGQPAEKTYSVRGYADVILSGQYSNYVQDLVRNMLVYGGAAQHYFDVNTGKWADQDITVAEVIVPGDDLSIEISDQLDDINFYGASMVMRSKTAVRFYFTTASVQDLTFTVDGEDYTPVSAKGMYCVEVAGINPHELADELSMVVSDGTNSLTVSYSPVNYITRMYHKSGTSAQLKTLVKAMYGYYLAATAYIANR